MIGCGLAGLGATNALSQNGMRVTVLEARSRPGGRCSSFMGFGTYPVDAGAAWIHGVDQNPIDTLTSRYHLKRNWIGTEKYPIFHEEVRILQFFFTFIALTHSLTQQGGHATDDMDETIESLWNFLLDLVKCEEENESHEIASIEKYPPIFSSSRDGNGQSLAEALDRALRNEMKIMELKSRDSTKQWPEHILKQRNSSQIRQALSLLKNKRKRDIAIRLLGWNLSHLEYANATDAWKLSKKHWDEDDAGYLFSGIEVGGLHCSLTKGT